MLFDKQLGSMTSSNVDASPSRVEESDEFENDSRAMWPT